MILAVDLGSTSFKAAVFDDNYKIVAKGSHKLNYVYPEQGMVELLPAEVETGIKACISQALSDCPADIQAVSITSQAQTFSIFDQTGRAKQNFISWLDERAKPTCLKLQEQLTDFSLHSGFGQLSPASQSCIIKHMIDTGQCHIDPTDKVVPLIAYAAKLLTGDYVVDNNMAAMDGFYSLVENNWWHKTMDLCGLQAKQLPELVAIGENACQTGAGAEAVGLKSGIPVILAGNDQTAGAFGADLHQHNSILMTLGTAYVVYAVKDQLPQPAEGWMRGVYPGGKFYRLKADKCGAGVIEWATAMLAPDQAHDPDAIFDMAEQAVCENQELIFNPELVAGNGGWSNLSIRTTRNDLAHAVVTSLAERVAGMVRDAANGHNLDYILAAGGHSKAKLYLNMLEKRVHNTFKSITADPLLGAAKMGYRAIT